MPGAQDTLLKIFIVISVFAARLSVGLQLTAHLSQSGLHGSVSFTSNASSDSINIKLELQDAAEPSSWSWSVRTFPVLYSRLEDRCGEGRVGQSLVNFDDFFGKIHLPGNESSEVRISSAALVLTGNSGIWGRSLLFAATDGSDRKACATITVSGEADEKVAEARFNTHVAGSIFLRWLGSHHASSSDTLILVDLHAVADHNTSTEHSWKIYATDVLDTEADKARENCDFLQLVFSPVYSNATIPVGDLEARLGKVTVARAGTRMAAVYHDLGLTSITVDLLDGQRSLYFVIFDEKHSDSFLACAKIVTIQPTILKSIFQSKGVKGDVTLSQRSPFDPTWINFNLSSAENFLTIHSYRIHELPPPPFRFPDHLRDPCLETGDIYNPGNTPTDQGSASHDTYPVGDLSGKHNVWQKEQTLSEINGRVWDTNLPLYGPFSVAHRSVVFFRTNSSDILLGRSEPLFCGTLARYAPQGHKVPMTTASIVFRYPIVGRVLFRQARDEPWSDTTMLVEYLIHADGTSQNNTREHRWMVHDLPPGRDFYNWTGRCLSAGPVYNPYKVPVRDASDANDSCHRLRPGLCRVGDLTSRHGRLDIAGRRKEKHFSRTLFTDSQVALSGIESILGRSLVVYDDHGPVARGERLACSTITAVYRRKAVVHNWFGNGELTPISGKMEVIQLTEYDVSDVEVDMQGLEDNKGYHVHVASVDEALDFPCEDSTVYGHWNPLQVNPSHSPPPAHGTADQYEMGDLSGKYGTLEGLRGIHADYNDTMLPLFGPHSILGRSVVIHKREKNSRWACSTIERGYAPSEARELRAIASFHNPLGYAFGYVRMTQLVYNDGSKSDTVIQVKLRHPGTNDRNVSRNHNWAIFVNPVGVDATTQFESHRCVAGGYRWNPYYTQLADPLNEDLYREECAPDNPLRCYVGDLSGRLGTIDLGDQRKTFSDVNVPLEGTETALGKSIVIMTKDRGSQRYACANIEPDHDIIKFANIRKPPRFVMAAFMTDIRSVLGIPEWMLTVDSRKTKILHDGACVQFLMHFKGPIASKLEQDFTFLLNGKKLAMPSLSIPGVVPNPKRKMQVSFRPCGSRTASNVRGYVNQGHPCSMSASSWIYLFLVLVIHFDIFV